MFHFDEYVVGVVSLDGLLAHGIYVMVAAARVIEPVHHDQRHSARVAKHLCQLQYGNGNVNRK